MEKAKFIPLTQVLNPTPYETIWDIKHALVQYINKFSLSTLLIILSDICCQKAFETDNFAKTMKYTNAGKMLKNMSKIVGI